MIRPGSLQDLSLILNFDIFAGSRSQEINENRLYIFENTAADICGYIAEARDGLLGRPYISYLMVSPNYRRKGIASQLLQHLEQKHYSQRLFISTEADNQPMLTLLNTRGYVHAGAISAANLNGVDELYFYKDIS